MSKVIFKKIRGYSDYSVSSKGEVISHKFGKEKVLVPSTTTGYKKVSLVNSEGVPNTFQVHRLVAQAFIKNPKKLPIVNHINGDKLEKYYCKKPIALGVNMKIFYQLIRIIEKDDILTLTHEEDSNRLGIFITNEKRKIKTRYYLNLMDATKEIRKLPDIEYKSVVMIPSDTFHKICRFMSEWSENIEIKCVDSQLTLSCEGDTVDQATTIGQSTDGLVFERNDNPEKIIEGVFSLKYLILFTKCSKLCEVIHVHLQNDLPLTIVYKIGLIGDIKLCLAPNPSDD